MPVIACSRRLAAALIASGAGMAPWPCAAHGVSTAAALPWTLDPWILAPLLLAALLFGLGLTRLRPRVRQRRGLDRKAACFASGWLVLAAALTSPLHAAGERSFAAHMLEHELLMLVAAPLLVLSRPLGVWLWAFGPLARRRIAGLGAHGALALPWRAFTHPLVATAVQAAVLWLWHVPAAFDLALSHPGWHALQHLCFLGSALLFWWAMLTGPAQRAGVAVGCLFFTSLVSGALGALMAFSRGPWYAGYSALGLDAFGLSPAEDQQLAGLLMWVPGGLLHAAAGIWMLARGLDDPPRAWTPLLALALLPASVRTDAAPGGRPEEPGATRTLRVCADPNNLPFSDRQERGLENRLARLLARDLGARVEYIWWAQRRGALRNTLNAGRCDVVPGIASDIDGLATTAPYYRASYVFLSREDSRWARIGSFDDPLMRQARIGVQLVGDDGANTPPAHALSRRGVVGNVRGYMVYGNYAQPAPQAAIVDAVARDEIDVAVAWGPTAAYFAQRQPARLHMSPVSPEQDGPEWPMAFDISMGVRRDDPGLLHELDAALVRNRPAVQALLREYGIPTADTPGGVPARRTHPRR